MRLIVRAWRFEMRLDKRRGWSLLDVARERGRGGLGLSLLGSPRPLLRLRTLRRFYRSVTHAALYAPLGVIMIIIALAIFNVLEAGNGSSYYGRSYNPPRSRYPPI